MRNSLTQPLQLPWDESMTGQQMRSAIADQLGLPLGLFSIIVADTQKFIHPTIHATSTLLELDVARDSTIEVVNNVR